MNDRQDQISLNVFEQIDSICKEFRRAYRVGGQPQIEDWIHRVNGNAQSTLFSNLLEIEIRIREKNDEGTNSEEYLKRFPRFASKVRQAFDESTIGSMEVGPSSTGKPDDDQVTRTFEIPAANRLGDYELIGELGRGGFGVVYKARHLTHNNIVALKTLPTGVDGQEVNADRLHKFRREFRSLSEVNHPNLVGMQTLEVDGDQWFFTMDLIRGEDFLSFVRPDDELDESRLRTAVSQLATGIIALHERRIIHRDLKPSNVLVEPDGKVKILDFGLVAELQTAADQTASLKSAHFAGTPRYAAPEQMFGQRSEASDWYALGVMLYESLTGNPPFSGKPMELLRQKQHEDPPELAGKDGMPNDLASELRDLAELTDGLLKREPIQRLNAASIIETLQLDQETRSHGTTGSAGSSGSVDEEDLNLLVERDEEVILIGREEQLAQLEAAKQELLEKQEPVVVWITGKSGEGKSALAEKFLRPLRMGTEMLVLSGRCYDRESMPFKAIDCLIDALVAFLRSRKSTEVSSLLPADIILLVQLFPVLKRVESIAAIARERVSGIDDRQIRFRAFAALKELLHNISQSSPIIMFIDDLQWGDADSAQVAFDLLSPPSPPAAMFLGSYRADEFSQSGFLLEWQKLNNDHQSLTNQRHVRVDALDQSQCVEMLAMCTGINPEKIGEHADDCFQNTNGNPYFLEQLAEGFDVLTDSFQPVPLEQIIDTKLHRCPEQAAQLLDVIAVSRRSIPIAELIEIAQESAEAIGTLSHMRNERLVRLAFDGERQLVDTYHDKVRESILDQMGDDYRCNLHRRFGEFIEEFEGINESIIDNHFNLNHDSPERLRTNYGRISDLAFHFCQAKDPKAFSYQFLAGEESASAYAIEAAFEHFSKAESLDCNQLGSTHRFLLFERLGWTSLRSNQAEQSIEYYRQALDASETEMQRATAYAGLGETHTTLGNCNEAIAFFDSSLKEVGFPRSQGRWKSGFDNLALVLRIVLVPIGWQKSTNSTDIRRSKMACDIHESLAPPFSEKNSMDMLASCMKCYRHACVTGNHSLIQTALGRLGYSFAVFGVPVLVKYFDRRSLKIDVAASIKNMEKESWKSSVNAMVKKGKGCLRDSLNDFEIAFRLHLKCGQSDLACRALEFRRHVHGFVSSTTVELQDAQQQILIAQSCGHKQANCWGRFGIADALARAGQLNSALVEMNIAIRFFKQEKLLITESVGRTTFAYVWLQCSNYEMALKQAQTAWRMVIDDRFYFLYAVHSLPILIESFLGPTWNDGKSVTRQRSREIRKLLRKSSLIYFMFPMLRCLIQRARGRAFFAMDKPRRGQRYFEKAIKQAKKLETDYDLARCLLDLAAVKEVGREENRREAIELLKKMESVIPRAESWLLGDQYDETVVAPEFDLEAGEREHGEITPVVERTE